MTARWGQVSGITILATSEGEVPTVRVGDLVALVVVGPPPARYTPVAEFALLAATQKEKVVTQVAEFVALVSYIEGGTEKFNSRAWGFNFDQHQFYVLHLGVEGTFVYDILTQQWAEWETQGFGQWNAEAGIEWNGEVYFGDNTLPTLWKLNPDSYLDDDFRLIQRVVTGGIPAEARDTIRTGMFVLSATKQGELDDESVPYVQLSISDDGGETFNDRDALTIDAATPKQDFSWRGLGTIRAPGRVFKITDEGGFVTIKGADQKLAGEKDG